MVWVNGKQNSGLVKFVSESRFPLIGISYINQIIMAVKALKLVSKMALMK